MLITFLEIPIKRLDKNSMFHFYKKRVVGPHKTCRTPLRVVRQTVLLIPKIHIQMPQRDWLLRIQNVCVLGPHKISEFLATVCGVCSMKFLQRQLVAKAVN